MRPKLLRVHLRTDKAVLQFHQKMNVFFVLVVLHQSAIKTYVFAFANKHVIVLSINENYKFDDFQIISIFLHNINTDCVSIRYTTAIRSVTVR